MQTSTSAHKKVACSFYAIAYKSLSFMLTTIMNLLKMTDIYMVTM